MGCFSISWLHGFQDTGVIARSSPARLGMAWVEPGGFVVSEVSWIVRLEESSDLRGELFHVVFPLDFGGSDLALEA